MTRRDSWKNRDCVLRYWAYRDTIKILAIQQGLALPEAGSHIVFSVPMPSSWSEKQRKLKSGTPHQQRPDIDNYLKGFFDALCEDDSYIYDIRASKVWAEEGKIEVFIQDKT